MASPAIQNWTLGPHGGLSQRGFSLESQTSVLEADNLNFLTDSFLSMRNAFGDVDLTGSGLAGEVQWMARHVTTDGTEELWAAANNSGSVACARRSGGVWSSVSLIDTPVAASLSQMQAVTFNGKLFLAYKSAVNRLHVWDGSAVRRVGLIKPEPPTVADTGSGSYATTERHYRVAFRIKVGDDIVCQSELSEAETFTPSGSGSAARITKPATVDSATHWVVFGLLGSSEDTYDLYEELAELAVGTTTYDDAEDPASYDGDAPPILGSNIPPPSVKFLTTEGTRVIMAGAWENSASAGQTDPANDRVWFTRAAGATDVGDDEAIPNGLWLDIGDAGFITALGTIYTDVYVFKFGSVHKLVPTQDPDGPYAPVLVSETFGCIGQRCLTNGETDDGFGAIFFADDHAVYRLAYGAVVPYSEPVGRDMRAFPLTADGSILAYDPYRRVLLINVQNAATNVVGSYSAFITDAVKKRWSGFSLGGQTSGWQLGVGMLGTTTTLVGGDASIRAAVVARGTDGTLRLHVGGQDDSGGAVVRTWSKRNALDGDVPFAAKVRARRIFQGKVAQVFSPLVYYRNPQNSTDGTLTCSVVLTRTYTTGDDSAEESLSQSFTMETTADDNGIAIKRKSLNELRMGEAEILDCTVEMSYSGTAFDSATSPTIEAIVIPYKTQERAAA